MFQFVCLDVHARSEGPPVAVEAGRRSFLRGGSGCGADAHHRYSQECCYPIGVKQCDVSLWNTKHTGCTQTVTLLLYAEVFSLGSLGFSSSWDTEGSFRLNLVLRRFTLVTSTQFSYVYYGRLGGGAKLFKTLEIKHIQKTTCRYQSSRI